MTQKITDLVVVGAGPAGMMSAIKSAERGIKVIIVDPNTQAGRKLRITGKGRCNVTNNCEINEYLKNICREGKFLQSGLRKFGPHEVMEFFEELGVPLKTERGNRVFPISDNANDIADSLVKRLKKLNCRFEKGRVTEILINDDSLSGVRLSDGTVIICKAIVLATGGMSYPKTGSDGMGYELAKRLGHEIIPPRGALVPIVSDDPCCQELQGLSLKNVDLSLFKSDKQIHRERGELLFTHFGLSGPLVLSASSLIDTPDSGEWKVTIDLKPALDEQTLDKRILRDFDEFKNRELKNALVKLLPQSLIAPVIWKAGLNGETLVNSITREERLRLQRALKSFEILISGLRPIDEAIVTSGGINVKEINPRTMESKLRKGIYFAGEILNIDGFTGGFNLQVAWTTGFVAGCSIEV